MPIQFHCHKCQGWIEVDDEHAGGKAICPFCQAVNPVPGEARKPSTARPAEGAEPTPAGESPAGKGPYTGVPTEPTRPGMPEVPVSKPREEREKARYGRTEGGLGRFDAGRAGLPPLAPGTQRLTRIARYGLAAAILSIVLMIVPATIGVRYLPEATLQQFSQIQDLPPDQRQEFMKRATEQFADVLEDRPWIGGAMSLGMLLWILSVIANLIVIFAAGVHRRGHAWMGLGVNSILLFLCLCSGIMQRFMGS